MPRSGLTMKEAEIRRGDWLDPEAGKLRFGDYAETWVNDHVLKPRTEELYRGLLTNHLDRLSATWTWLHPRGRYAAVAEGLSRCGS